MKKQDFFKSCSRLLDSGHTPKIILQDTSSKRINLKTFQITERTGIFLACFNWFGSNIWPLLLQSCFGAENDTKVKVALTKWQKWLSEWEEQNI